MQPGGDTDHPEVSQAITDAVELHHDLGEIWRDGCHPSVSFRSASLSLCNIYICSYCIDLIFIIRINYRCQYSQYCKHDRIEYIQWQACEMSVHVVNASKGKETDPRASPKRYMMSEVMIKACASFDANNLSEIPLSLYQKDIFHKQDGLC